MLHKAIRASQSASSCPTHPAAIPIFSPAFSGQKLSEAWGQQVIIDNRPGAAGTVGAELVARAPADGYTLIMGSFGNIIVANSLYKNLKYDPFKDFASIALVSLPPGILVENPAVPAQNVRELIAYAKSNPGRLNYGSPGSRRVEPPLLRTLQRECGHFDRACSVQRHRARRGGFAGRPCSARDFRVSNRAAAYQKRQAARARRHQCQTLGPDDRRADGRGVGAAGYEAAGWFGVLAPAGTPQPVVPNSTREINRILELPEIKASLASDGAEPAGGTPAQMTESARAASAKWSKLIRELNLRTE